MYLDSILIRRLFFNLSKCSIIRVDLRCFQRLVYDNFRRNYNAQTVAHSTGTPFHNQGKIESSSLYVNPDCMQMDQLMYSCRNYEEVLNLLVTQRGSMYLHNLVTVMKILRGFVENEDFNRYKPDCDDLYMGYNTVFQKQDDTPEASIDMSHFTEAQREVVQKAQSEVISRFRDPRNREYLQVYNHNRDLRDSIIRDDRYDLLLQDLYVNKNKLDVVSICEVIITLDALNHRYYRLYNGLLKRLLSLDISFCDETPSFVNNVGLLLLKTCHCYARGGFYDIPLYNKVSNELFKTNVLSMMMDSEHHHLLSHIIRLYGLVESYDFSIFSKISEIIHRVKLSPSDLTWLAVTFSNHLNFNKIHDRVLYHVAKKITDDSSSFSMKQLLSCVSSFSKMRLYFKDVWIITTNRLIQEIDISMGGFDDMDLSVKEICKAVHDIATVDNTGSMVQTLLDKASLYLEERLDDLDEESSINMALGILTVHPGPSLSSNMTDSQGDQVKEENKQLSDHRLNNDLVVSGVENTMNLNNYLLSFLWRNVGSDLVWEREPLKVFAIWLYHMLVFPHFKYNIHKRCILPCYRQWLLAYHTRHEIRDEASKIIKNLSEKYRIYSKLDSVESFSPILESPVPIDFLVLDERFGNKAINVVDSLVRNESNRPMGVDLLIKRILEHFGLEVHVIDAHMWMSLDTEGRTRLVESIIVNET